MSLRFEYGLKKYEEQIKGLLEKADLEFTPPLSSRKSPTQVSFKDDSADHKTGIQSYFDDLKKQKFIIALIEDMVVGFISYVVNPIFCESKNIPKPCCYITTIIIHPDYRNLGIATILYNQLFKKNKGRNIATRTWHDRNGTAKHNYHTDLLVGKLRFSECYRIENERGEGIDTVYYCRKNMSFSKKLIAYKLTNKINVLVVLALITVVSIILFTLFPSIRNSEILSEIVKSVFTSLFVSILVMASETYVSFKDGERDSFLLDISEFGISELNRDKRVELDRLLAGCRKNIWISGYRLTMTDNLKEEFGAAVRRGARGKAVLCGPWTDTYNTIFGTPEPEIIDHYIKICGEILSNMGPESVFTIRFTNKPLFNDTYKIDDKLVTGPFLHNRENGKPLHAKDFFSYTIKDKDSVLYKRIEDDFFTLFDHEYAEELNWGKFKERFFTPEGDKLDIKSLSDISREKKTEMFISCLDKKS